MPSPPRQRIRSLLPTLNLGPYPPGPSNSLTDIPGVKVHTKTLTNAPDPGTINTGLTTILPRPDWPTVASYAGTFSFNGAGEMTGTHEIAESGVLSSPIILTGTLGVGAAHEGVYRSTLKTGRGELILPVVAETYDGFLHEAGSFAVRPEHVGEGIEGASCKGVDEGNVGGGTGMMCHGFKGGTGSSSRVVALGTGEKKEEKEKEEEKYTIAALVQANYGAMKDLRIGGVPIGRILAEEKEDTGKVKQEGSIIVVIATDAPMHPLQLQRIAKRATVGLARVGGQGHNLSGDIFLAFSTANAVPVEPGKGSSATMSVDVVHDPAINALFEATADATEEAIYNALCMAETMVGYKGRTVEALPLGRVREIMERSMATGAYS